MAALSSAILDRRATFIESEHGMACILPMEDYIRLMSVNSTLAHVIRHIQDRNMQGVLETVKSFSKWLLEGGGEDYTLNGEPDANTL
ncbi:hypothetical protein [Microcoleus phage My-WqHQDG]|nr:hypothetical protein [Microcoleus phage My-WqHQDG]